MNIESKTVRPHSRLVGRALDRPRSGGAPFPLGATWDGIGVNFALFSAHATKVELCLFDINGEREIERIELPEYTDEIWHGYLPEARPGHRLRLSRARALRARRTAIASIRTSC